MGGQLIWFTHQHYYIGHPSLYRVLYTKQIKQNILGLQSYPIDLNWVAQHKIWSTPSFKKTHQVMPCRNSFFFFAGVCVMGFQIKLKRLLRTKIKSVVWPLSQRPVWRPPVWWEPTPPRVAHRPMLLCIFVLLQFKYQFGCTNFYLCGTGAFEIGIRYLGFWGWGEHLLYWHFVLRSLRLVDLPHSAIIRQESYMSPLDGNTHALPIAPLRLQDYKSRFQPMSKYQRQRGQHSTIFAVQPM